MYNLHQLLLLKCYLIRMADFTDAKVFVIFIINYYNITTYKILM